MDVDELFDRQKQRVSACFRFGVSLGFSISSLVVVVGGYDIRLWALMMILCAAFYIDGHRKSPADGWNPLR